MNEIEEIQNDFRKELLINQNNSGLNDSNQQFEDNLLPISMNKDNNDFFTNNNNSSIDLNNEPTLSNEEENKFDIQKLINNNQNFREIYSMINNKKAFNFNQYEKKDFRGPNDFTNFSTNNIKNLKKEKKSNFNFSSQKMFAIYHNIASLSLGHKYTQSIGKYPAPKRVTKLTKPSRNESKLFETFLTRNKKKKKEDDSFFDFNASKFKNSVNLQKTNKTFGGNLGGNLAQNRMKSLKIESWIGKQRNTQRNGFFYQKNSGIKTLLSETKSPSLLKLNQPVRSSKQNLFYDSYNGAFFDNELQKFTTRLNNQRSVSQNKTLPDKKSNSSLLSNYIDRKIKFQKSRKEKLF